MRIIGIVVIVFLALTLTAFGQKSGGGKVDLPSDVRAAFDRLIEGIEQVKAEKVMAAYEKSDRLLIFNNNGSATIGWENVRANVTATYAKTANVTLEITGFRVEMVGKTAAYATCKWKQTQESDGKLESAAGRMTLIYKLVGKEWKISHRHTSPDRPEATRPVFPSERG